jgi:hypothetical protein
MESTLHKYDLQQVRFGEGRVKLDLLSGSLVPSVLFMKCRPIGFNNPWDLGRVIVLLKESGKLLKICTYEHWPPHCNM